MISEIKAGNWRRPALIIFVLAGITMAVVLLLVGSWLTFFADDWFFIFGRQSGELGDFLRPQTDAFVLFPAVVYYVLLHAFGMSNYYPFLLVDWAAHFACVVLLAHIVTRHTGVLIGLVAGLSLLFLGSAFEDLFQPFQMLYLFSAAGGLLAIDLLEREVRSRRVLGLAGAALLFAIASSGVGPIMVGLIVVWAFLRRDRAALLVAAVALVSYGIWFLGWQGTISRDAGIAANLPLVPLELVFGIGAAIAGVLGLPPARFAWVGLAVGIALVVIALRRGIKPTPLAVAALVALVIQNALQAVFRGAMGFEHGARSGYLYPGAIFLWLAIAGWIGRRVDPPRWVGARRLLVPALVGLLVVPMALGNMTQFFLAARATRVIRATELRELGLVVQLRDVPNLALDLAIDTQNLASVTPRKYFTAVDRFGVPQVAVDRPADDLPGPDAAQLNFVAVRLLGGAIQVGPDGGPSAVAPVLVVAKGTASPDKVPGCTLLMPESGGADATWSPPASGVAIRADGQGETHVLLGLYEPADQRMEPALEAALQRTDAIWLPTLPPSLAWTMRVQVDGDAVIHVCSRDR